LEAPAAERRDDGLGALEQLDLERLGLLREAGHGSRAEQPARVEHDDGVARTLDVAHQVGGDDDADPELAADATDEAGGPLYRDSDEWPGRRYQRGDPVLHIAFRQWADLLIVAPLDANTLAKFALGLADNFVTCLFRAWDFQRPVILAPAMNTLMWQSPVTLRHLRQLLADRGDGLAGDGWILDEAAEVLARHAPRLILVPPQAKRLACGDIGVGAMAEVTTLAETVRRWITEQGVAGDG